MLDIPNTIIIVQCQPQHDALLKEVTHEYSRVPVEALVFEGQGMIIYFQNGTALSFRDGDYLAVDDQGGMMRIAYEIIEPTTCGAWLPEPVR